MSKSSPIVGVVSGQALRCLVLVTSIVWSQLSSSALAQSFCQGGSSSSLAGGSATSDGCSFQPASKSTVLSPGMTAHLLLSSSCQTGWSPSCNTHQYTFSTSSTHLRTEQVTPVVINSTNLILNISASGFRNRPGNFSIEVRGFDQNCSVFHFCWFLAVEALPSTLATFDTISVTTHASYQAAFENRVPIPVQVSEDFSPFYGSIDLSSKHSTSLANATFNMTFSVRFREPSFTFNFISVGFISRWGYWTDAQNITWSQAVQVFGFLLEPPVRNSSHFFQTLYWAPTAEWARRRFLITVQARDAVNYYPNSGYHYVGLEVTTQSSASPVRPGLLASLCLVPLVLYWL